MENTTGNGRNINPYYASGHIIYICLRIEIQKKLLNSSKKCTYYFIRGGRMEGDYTYDVV